MEVILDTNVLSELLRPEPDPVLRAWIRDQPSEDVFTTAVTQAEMLVGVVQLPPGRRRSALEGGVRRLFDEAMAGQILSFDSDAARVFADIVATRRQLGKPISQFDAQIAAIARIRGATLATRNSDDFADCGIEVIDPWQRM